MPTNFQLSPLPNEISLWITCTLEKLKKSTACKTKHTKTAREHGNGGCPGWTGWASRETPSLMRLQYLRGSDWSAALQSVYADANTVLPDTRNHWLLAQSSRPSLIWERTFRTTIDTTHTKTQMEQHSTSGEIECHSIRSGAAMSMYLQKIAVFTIMFQGRWCSDAFLRYIRRQVKEFSQGVSEAMISKKSYAFFTVTDSANDADFENPRIPNNSNSLTSSHNGRSAVSAFTRHHIFE